jgi:hypothetical protein
VLPAQNNNYKPLETKESYLQNQAVIDKLRMENVELKKNLEREQLLHTMLYKEWKELNERALAGNGQNEGVTSKNLFYKYGFYILLIAMIPAYFLMNAGKGTEKTTPSSQTAPAPAPQQITPIIDSASTTGRKAASDKTKTVQQAAPEQPVTRREAKPEEQSVAKSVAIPEIKPEIKTAIRPDSLKQKKAIAIKPVEVPLTDSARDEIYWQGWNAYYSRSSNHFSKSSEKYKVWLEGWSEGRNDARKLLAKDSLEKK